MSTVIAVTYFVISVSWADGIILFGSFVLTQFLPPPTPLSLFYYFLSEFKLPSCHFPIALIQFSSFWIFLFNLY